jgi:hypothetical protein
MPDPIHLLERQRDVVPTRYIAHPKLRGIPARDDGEVVFRSMLQDGSNLLG